MKHLAVICTFIVVAACARESGPVVESGWVRAAPPGTKTMAGYLELHNRGATPIRLTGASSPQYAHVMLHRTVVADGVARMQHEDAVTIAAGDRFAFAPGGWHLMLMGPDPQPVLDDTVRLVLHFDGNPDLPVDLPVREAMP